MQVRRERIDEQSWRCWLTPSEGERRPHHGLEWIVTRDKRNVPHVASITFARNETTGDLTSSTLRGVSPDDLLALGLWAEPLPSDLGLSVDGTALASHAALKRWFEREPRAEVKRAQDGRRRVNSPDDETLILAARSYADSPGRDRYLYAQKVLHEAGFPASRSTVARWVSKGRKLLEVEP